MRTDGNSFRTPQTYPERWLKFGRFWFGLRALWRRLRISRWLTRLLGPQYRRSRDRIEVDITYACNLHCLNCNRSVRQAPEALNIELDAVRRFVDQSVARGKQWKRIRVLGGEPTLHPRFFEIMAELERYRASCPSCLIEVVTNGHGDFVDTQLRQLPSHVWIDNSRKKTEVQPAFRPFNEAPEDDPHYRHADFSNGCAIMRDCGMGLTPLGYYPCAVAGGIERITGCKLARDVLPGDEDGMLEAATALCRLCGRFKDGHYVPKNLREPLEQESISPTWQRLYSEWHMARATQGSAELVQVGVDKAAHGGSPAGGPPQREAAT